MDAIQIVIHVNDYQHDALPNLLALICWLYSGKPYNIDVEIDPTYFEPEWEAA